MTWVDATVWKCDRCEEVIVVPIGFVGPEVEAVADHECHISFDERVTDRLLRSVWEEYNEA